MSEHFKNLNDLISLLEVQNTPEKPEDLALNTAKDVDDYTFKLLEDSGLPDPLLGDDDYLNSIEQAFSFINNEINAEVDLTENSDHIHVDVSDEEILTIDDQSLNKFSNSELIDKSLTSALMMIEQFKEESESIPIKERKVDAEIITLENVDAKLHFRYMSDGEQLSSRTFNIKLNGQLVDDYYVYDAVEFKDEYLYNNSVYKLASEKPTLIHFNSDQEKENKEKIIYLEYVYVSKRAGEKVSRDIRRIITFVDENDNEIEELNANSSFNSHYTFEGVYQENDKIKWINKLSNTKYKSSYKYNFPAISTEELNKFLEPFGYRKKGAAVAATVSSTDSHIDVYVEKVVCVFDESLKTDLIESEVVESTEPTEENEATEAIGEIEVSEPNEITEEIEVNEEIEHLTYFDKSDVQFRSIKFIDIDSKEVIYEAEQSRFYTYKQNALNEIKDESYQDWLPSVTDISIDDYKISSMIDSNEQLTVFMKSTYERPKISIEDIIDAANESYDELPIDLVDQKYLAYETINEILSYSISNSGYHKGFMMRLNNKYQNRMISNINSFRSKLNLRPLKLANEMIDNKNLLSNIVLDASNRHNSEAVEPITSFDDYIVIFENNLTKTNVISLGQQITPEALADYIFKSILIEYDYIAKGEVENWQHLKNLVYAENLIFTGSLFVGNYFVQNKGEEPFDDIDQHVYNLTITDKFIKRF